LPYRSLADFLDDYTAPGTLFEPAGDAGVVRCQACAHACRLKPGQRGICKVRFNRDGELRVPWGYVSGLNADPIEKKPFSHFLPGATALTFGMLGCNFHCQFCQNWVTSQVLRDPASDMAAGSIQALPPRQLVEVARRTGSRVVASSYNEPIITAEWAMALFAPAREAGLRTVMISNGHASPRALKTLHPLLDGLKVDLKCMQAESYRRLGGSLQAVLATIQLARELGIWLEVVTLVVPGFNDSSDELWQAARFLTSVSPDIPWHVTAYHPAYQEDAPPTPAATLQRAAEIGQEAGLRYVYAGNLPGRVGSLEDTRCPACGALLVERTGYRIRQCRLDASGLCPCCGTAIAGVWSSQ